MTKREREQVVMLLRCAADNMYTGHSWTGSRGIVRAAVELGFDNDWPFTSSAPLDRALRAYDYAAHKLAGEFGGPREMMFVVLLEAAALVEEGALP